MSGDASGHCKKKAKSCMHLADREMGFASGAKQPMSPSHFSGNLSALKREGQKPALQQHNCLLMSSSEKQERGQSRS